MCRGRRLLDCLPLHANSLLKGRCHAKDTQEVTSTLLLLQYATTNAGVGDGTVAALGDDHTLGHLQLLVMDEVAAVPIGAAALQ